ncbi:acyl carrier protein [Actinomadura graeca]|uniref:Acyl carrier protein n=1 Tax=Actinomadura graeca TaxID=2750812 RepID=A0ABX8QSX2_9ACTN|nr:acyl carrier protein [Actinomadura graeca]QXJ21825.1 acyl carrier protein [Actinomadura graeca]
MIGRNRKASKPDGPLTADSLRHWLTETLAGRIGIDPGDLDTARSFESYGLDSRVAVQVSGALERFVDRRLSPGLLYAYPTVDELGDYLVQELDLAERT